MLYRLIIAVLAALLAGAIGFSVWASWGMGSLEAENLRLRLALDSCENRLISIDEERKSDEEAADPVFIPPTRWLVP